MTKNIIRNTFYAASALVLVSCTKMQDIGILNTGGYENLDKSTPLKDAAAFPIGTAISPTPFNNDAKYREAVLRDFNSVTFEYHMKHGAIQRSNGTKDFTTADNMMNALNGIPVFGHTLAWHQNQNASYLNTVLGLSSDAPVVELINNGTLESGALGDWGVWNSAGGAASVTVTNNATYVFQGTYAMKVVNPVNGNPWNVQIASNAFPTVAGKSYRVSFNIRTESGSGQMRLSTSGTDAQYGPNVDVTSSYQPSVWTFTGITGNTRLMIDIGAVQGTYYIDNFSVIEVSEAPTGPALVRAVDSLLEDYITATVNHFKGKVKAWDVVNEMFTDNGAIRNSVNTTIPEGATDYFLWSGYLGRDFAYNAFKYAEAADPAADLYINDFNLEYSPQKVDSLIKHVAELKERGAKVDGIGTQMHISWRTDLGKMEDMFRKLGQTGLKIRISELDIKTVMGSPAGAPTDLLNSYQAAMAKKVVELYVKHIPAPQRAGITIWGINDGNSWVSDGGKEFALFYDDNYEKKPAYGAFLAALLGKE